MWCPIFSTSSQFVKISIISGILRCQNNALAQRLAHQQNCILNGYWTETPNQSSLGTQPPVSGGHGWSHQDISDSSEILNTLRIHRAHIPVLALCTIVHKFCTPRMKGCSPLESQVGHSALWWGERIETKRDASPRNPGRGPSHAKWSAGRLPWAQNLQSKRRNQKRVLYMTPCSCRSWRSVLCTRPWTTEPSRCVVDGNCVGDADPAS